jgi:hypothetical protein
VNNSYRFILPENDQSIDIPIEIKWDFQGHTDSIELYEDEVLEEIIGLPKDYEICRFAHDFYGIDRQSQLEYQFYFFNGTSVDIPTSVDSDWEMSYRQAGFSINELYYKTNPIKKSFFKIDFYDSTSGLTQKNYFTIIIPTNSNERETITLNPVIGTTAEIIIPNFILDYVFDKEGFFIYWLRDFEILKLSEFYMSVKFFDAKNGVFIRMMTVPQSQLTGMKYLFNQDNYFYRKVNLDYSTFTYKVYDIITGLRVGNGTPLQWYEYINPPQE